MKQTLHTRGFAAIGLYAPKCEPNVGGVLRAALNYDAALIAIEGQRYYRQSSDVLASSRHVPLIHAPLMDVIPHGAVPVAVELVEGAHSLVNYVHPQSAYYIFGPEDGSVPTRILSRCRDVVYVPTQYCMNLAATVNVLLYDRMAKKLRSKSRCQPLELVINHNP